jgi:hypothetical protein
MLSRQAQALQKGIEPLQASTPSAYRVRSMAILADRHVPWQALMEEHMPLPA